MEDDEWELSEDRKQGGDRLMERLRRKVHSADDEMILNMSKDAKRTQQAVLGPDDSTNLKVRPAHIYDEKFSAGGLSFLHHFVQFLRAHVERFRTGEGEVGVPRGLFDWCC